MNNSLLITIDLIDHEVIVIVDHDLLFLTVSLIDVGSSPMTLGLIRWACSYSQVW
jgi:hypothetical protein